MMKLRKPATKKEAKSVKLYLNEGCVNYKCGY